MKHIGLTAPLRIHARANLLLLWMLGVPLPVLVLIALFRH